MYASYTISREKKKVFIIPYTDQAAVRRHDFKIAS